MRLVADARGGCLFGYVTGLLGRVSFQKEPPDWWTAGLHEGKEGSTNQTYRVCEGVAIGVLHHLGPPKHLQVLRYRALGRGYRTELRVCRVFPIHQAPYTPNTFEKSQMLGFGPFLT